MDGYISAREAARRMGVTAQTVYNWAASGKLDVVRVGRTIRVNPNALPGQDRDVASLAQLVEAAGYNDSVVALVDSTIASLEVNRERLLRLRERLLPSEELTERALQAVKN